MIAKFAGIFLPYRPCMAMGVLLAAGHDVAGNDELRLQHVDLTGKSRSPSARGIALRRRRRTLAAGPPAVRAWAMAGPGPLTRPSRLLVSLGLLGTWTFLGVLAAVTGQTARPLTLAAVPLAAAAAGGLIMAGIPRAWAVGPASDAWSVPAWPASACWEPAAVRPKDGSPSSRGGSPAGAGPAYPLGHASRGGRCSG